MRCNLTHTCRLRPGLLARHRLACWMMTSMLRSSAKLPQLVGWVLVPPSTLTHVRAGTTLVADCVLPAAFEPVRCGADAGAMQAWASTPARDHRHWHDLVLIEYRTCLLVS